jgi:hypothetical protein
MFGDKLDIDFGELEGRKRPNKYRNVKRSYDGRLYDSRAEAERASQLDLLRSAGEVIWWIPQVTIELGDVKYRIDFLVAVDRGEWGRGIVEVHAEDVKGFETARFRLVRRLWPKYGPFGLHVIHRGKVEIISPWDEEAET